MKKNNINNPKDVDKLKVMQDIFINKYGLNSCFCNYSIFIKILFSRYINLGEENNTYFYDDKIVSSNGVIGDSPYTISITREGNLKVAYFSELISTNPDWSQHFKVETEIIYIPDQDGFKEITKKSHLYSGKCRTSTSENGTMVNKLDYIELTMREFKQDIENYRCTGISIKDEDCDIDIYHQPPISDEDIALLEYIRNAESLKKYNGPFNAVNVFKRDETFKEKVDFYHNSQEKGYFKKSYIIDLETLPVLSISSESQIWKGNLSNETIEETIKNILIKISNNLSIPYDNDKISIFISLMKCFIGRINYPKIKAELERIIANSKVEQKNINYDIADGQVIEVFDEKAKLFQQ